MGGAMRRRQWLVRFILCFAGALAQAQDASTGAIRGIVEDESGARIVGAQVVASDEANGIDRRTLSDGKGNFAAQLLTPGTYTVRIAAAGMQPATRTGIRVEVGAATQIAFRMQVAGAKESITVHSEGSATESEGNGVSSLIDSRAISELPLSSRRFTAVSYTHLTLPTIYSV